MRGFPEKMECASSKGRACCAYCGKNLSDRHSRLLSCVDHVIPVSETVRIGIDKDFAQSSDNLILCCTSCRALAEDYKVPDEIRPRKLYPDALTELRDRVFAERRALIARRRMQELSTLESRSRGIWRDLAAKALSRTRKKAA